MFILHFYDTPYKMLFDFDHINNKIFDSIKSKRNYD